MLYILQPYVIPDVGFLISFQFFSNVWKTFWGTIIKLLSNMGFRRSISIIMIGKIGPANKKFPMFILFIHLYLCLIIGINIFDGFPPIR